jgi:hypothetical protein
VEHITRTIEGVRSKKSRDHLKSEIRKLIYLNPEVLTDHYFLRLENAAERAVAERLCSINMWEMRRGEALNDWDYSMAGDHDKFRNFSYKRGNVEEVFNYKAVSVEFPPVGEVTMDYVASKRSQGDDPMNGMAFLQLCETLKACNIRGVARVLALRSVADRFCLSAEQIIDLSNALANACAGKVQTGLVKPDSTDRTRQTRQTELVIREPEGGIGEALGPDSNFLVTGETVRTHVILCMLSQCADVHTLFSCDERGGVYAARYGVDAAPHQLKLDEQQFLVHVLGQIVTFDPVNLYEGESNCGNLFVLDCMTNPGRMLLSFLQTVIAHEKVLNVEHHRDLVAQNPDPSFIPPPLPEQIIDVEWEPAEHDDSHHSADFDPVHLFSKPLERNDVQKMVTKLEGVLTFAYDRAFVTDLEMRKEQARNWFGWLG